MEITQLKSQLWVYLSEDTLASLDYLEKHTATSKSNAYYFRRGKRKKIDIPPLPPTNISLNLKPKDTVEQFAKKKHKKKTKTGQQTKTIELTKYDSDTFSRHLMY